MTDIARILKKNSSARGYILPTRVMPSSLVRLAELLDKPALVPGI